MFDDRLAAALGDPGALADLAGDTENESRIAGCRKLVLAAAWADVHSGVDHPDGGMLVERLVSIGPVGTPMVAEFAPQGLVSPFDCSVASARSWMADALTIRHRLPKLWERVVAGEVHHWKARQIATLTGHLNVHVAAEVDQHTAAWVEQLPWNSFLKALDATMLQADEVTYRKRAAAAQAKREVRAVQSEEGLKTLIARGSAGDVTMMMALYRRVAECLAEEGDEDPLPVRMSKAIGWIANPAKVLDLLARHAGDPDPHRESWEKVAAHQADETDPWVDDLPPAGWERAEHGNYHQPSFDEDEWWDTPRDDQPDGDEFLSWPTDPPVDDEDMDWLHQQQDDADDADDVPTDDDHETTESAAGAAETSGDHGAAASDASPEAPADVGDAGDSRDNSESDTDGVSPESEAPPDPQPAQRSPGDNAGDGQARTRWPEAFRPPGWRPLTTTQLAACAPTVVLHVHLSDQTLRDNHGVVRTDAGPILLEQLKAFLLEHDAQVKVYPVVDPAATASADSYEIPIRLRRAMAIRNPRSVFPHSPTMTRMDLDHTPAYAKDGPPGQTGMHSLGPVARCEHRPKTVGKWTSKQPTPGVYLWRSPQGWIMLTTNQGTLDLGHTDFATHLWNTAS